MKPPTLRAFRFVHPDFDAGEAPGLGLSPRGGAAMVEEDAAVRQSLLILFSTLPGERVMRPEYGCNLQRLVFAPNDDTTAGLAIHYVRQAIARFEPRVKILRLDAGRHPQASELLEIRLDYRLRADHSAGSISFAIDLGAGDLR